MSNLSCDDHDAQLKISVIIATINRADAMQNISLPSLLKQAYPLFEVIVWDASDGDDTQLLCEHFSCLFQNRDVALSYHRAPRRGLASQRNDAVKVATGDIFFFIDDDCEVSCDTLSALYSTFYSFGWLKAAGISMLNKTTASRNSVFKRMGARFWGMKNTSLRRQILRSGALSMPIKDLPGEAEWLSGGAMAYRKNVFDELAFEERLERFGGYAMGEDYDFSHRVMLHFKEPLLICSGGYIIHIAATTGGNRTVGSNRVAATFFNMYLIRNNFSKYKKMPISAFIWQLLGSTLALLSTGAGLSDLIHGVQKAISAMKELQGTP